MRAMALARRSARASSRASTRGASARASSTRDSVPFVAIVRSVVEETRPDYEFERATGGTGPVVFYRVPSPSPRVAQTVFFQKGLHSNWIRANVATVFLGKGGARAGEHELVQEALSDFAYVGAADLAEGVRLMLPAVERLVARQAKSAGKLAPALAKLFDGAPKHLATWMKDEGRALAPTAFEEESFGDEAFAAFEKWLRKKKVYVPAAELPLWHWWCDHLPTPAKPQKAGRARK